MSVILIFKMKESILGIFIFPDRNERSIFIERDGIEVRWNIFLY